MGHLSKLVAEDELSDLFGEFGDVETINLIPPRGCAFVCMNRRMDAYKALKTLHKHKLQGKPITVNILQEQLPQLLQKILTLYSLIHGFIVGLGSRQRHEGQTVERLLGC